MTTPSPIKVGFISYGHSTRTFHIPFILPSPSYAVAAFLQRNDVGTESRSGKPAPHCEIDFPNARRYRDMESFMRDGEIQLVVVASHTDSHGLYAEAAMRAGKDGESNLCEYCSASCAQLGQSGEGEQGGCLVRAGDVFGNELG
jgi:predicted dehydrogenase